eukprot:3760073-Rhodomonas_salina.3
MVLPGSEPLVTDLPLPPRSIDDGLRLGSCRLETHMNLTLGRLACHTAQGADARVSRPPRKRHARNSQPEDCPGCSHRVVSC